MTDELRAAIARKRKSVAMLAKIFAEYDAEMLIAGSAHVADDELILSAAESWARLEWMPLSVHPEHDGEFFGYWLSRPTLTPVVLVFENGTWSIDDETVEDPDDRAPYVWLSGPLPPLSKDPTDG